MRIVDLKTFLEMPEGTLFAKCDPCVIGEFRIKGENFGDLDFYYQDLQTFESHDSGQFAERFFEMVEKGASHPLELDCEGRDGMREKEQLFMIYEKDDISKLINRLQKCL